MKYSIIMPYYKREILHNTFVSFTHHYSERDDYEVIIMEDYKNVAEEEEHITLLDIIALFSPQITIRHIETDFKNCYDPCRMFNMGAREAKGDFLVLTNPECFHLTNVLDGFDRELDGNPNRYIVAGCLNATHNGIINEFEEFKHTPIEWYQHSKHTPRGLHFCSVISKNLYNSIGGFDEGYAPGFGREDVDFFRTIQEEGIEYVFVDDITVIHMNHPNIPGKHVLWEINKRYYAKKWGAMDNR